MRYSQIKEKSLNCEGSFQGVVVELVIKKAIWKSSMMLKIAKNRRRCPWLEEESINGGIQKLKEETL